MSRARGSLSALLLSAGVAAATTWVALLSWRGFADDSAGYLRPLLLLAVLVAGSGALARWYRLPGVVVVAVQVLLAVAVVSWTLTGSPLPVGPAYAELLDAFHDATTSADRYAPPVPGGVAPIDPLLIAGGLGCLLLVDLLACTLRRVPLAGLPLLAIYSIPVSLLDGGLSWWIFVGSAGGFLALLFLHENEQVARWGRPLGSDPTVSATDSLTVRTGAARASAGAIGGAATALAVVVPLFVPTLDVHVLDFGPGSGGGDEINLENPMTDLRRDLLDREVDLDLLQVTTDDPDPSYLRISVLNRFGDDEWTSGDRAIPGDQRADGAMPSLQGVADTVARTEYDYQVSVGSAFRSTWLPTQAPISSIQAPDDWLYDVNTMDFIAAGDDEHTTAGIDYAMTAVDLDLDAGAMAAAPPAAGVVPAEFLELPSDLPPMVRELTSSITANATSAFERGVAIQTWFRESGGFEYSLDVEPGNGADALVEFLTDKTGYCEQFASAMAVMARVAGIPARVAVGFLSPDPIGPRTYQYSSFDLHAWPELFIPGSGWVRFEPTPADRASGVPDYTQERFGPDPTAPVPSASGTAGEEGRPSDAASPSDEPTEAPAAEDAGAGGGGSGLPWLPVGGGLLVLVLLTALAVLPRTLRQRRREQRLDGDPETVWAELRDTATDLGVPWPDRRSPRETREHLVEFLGDSSSESPAERPAHGRHLAPGAVRSLDAIVVALERARYARAGDEPASLRPEGEACLTALRAGATPRAVRRAEWWPRSLFGSRAPAPRAARTESVHGGVVDHVR
jgi:transglutaminase-like putative cysteine protease